MRGRKKIKKDEKKVALRVFVKRKHYDLVKESLMKIIAKYEEDITERV